jgi:hypothetical protein
MLNVSNNTDRRRETMVFLMLGNAFSLLRAISFENRSAEQEFLKNKRKRRSCSLCKSHKTGHVNRWKDKDQILLKEADFDMRRIKYAASYTNVN